jgi:hypothetical protein
MQPFFAGDFYGAYPGVNLATDPFLALVNGSSGLAPGTALTGLVSRTSGGLVRSLRPVALLRVQDEQLCQSHDILP